jgi:hypothetical protein
MVLTEALMALGNTARAAAVAEDACRSLLETAARMNRPGYREAYLDLWENRRIRELAAQLSTR